MGDPLVRIQAISRTTKSRRWIGGLLAFLPLLPVVYIILQYGTNFPLSDEWMIVNLAAKIADGSVTFADLVAAHFEHRPLFPRLMLVSLAFLTGLNTKAAMFCSAALACACLFFFRQISSDQGADDNRPYWLLGLATGALTFSQTQFGNWLWGFQVVFLLVNFSFVFAVTILARSRARIWPLFAAAAACGVASYSGGHGLLAWAALTPLVLLSYAKHRFGFVLIWLLFSAGCWAVYLPGIEAGGSLERTEILTVTEQAKQMVRFFFESLGASLVGQQAINIYVGVGLVGLFAGLTARAYRRSQDKDQPITFFASWTSIGLFALLFAAATAYGRYGLVVPATSRYATPNLLLSVAVLNLGFILFSKRAFVALAAALLILLFSGTLESRRPIEGWHQTRQIQLACFELQNLIDPIRDCPVPMNLGARPELLEFLGFRSFLSRSDFSFNSKLEVGAIQAVTPERSGAGRVFQYHLRGWVAWPAQSQPALILVSYGKRNPVFISVAQIGSQRAGPTPRRRWESRVSLADMPLGNHLIRAWVYDSTAKRLVELKNAFGISNIRPDALFRDDLT